MMTTGDKRRWGCARRGNGVSSQVHRQSSGGNLIRAARVDVFEKRDKLLLGFGRELSVVFERVDARHARGESELEDVQDVVEILKDDGVLGADKADESGELKIGRRRECQLRAREVLVKRDKRTVIFDSAKSRRSGRALMKTGRTCEGGSQSVSAPWNELIICARRTRLVQRHGSDVLEDHPRDGSTGVVLSVVATSSIRLEERMEGSENGEVLSAEVRLRVENEGSHRERSVCLDFAVGIGEGAKEESKEFLRERSNGAPNPVHNFGEGSDGRAALVDGTFGVLENQSQFILSERKGARFEKRTAYCFMSGRNVGMS
jgi:hypothetical protein